MESKRNIAKAANGAVSLKEQELAVEELKNNIGQPDIIWTNFSYIGEPNVSVFNTMSQSSDEEYEKSKVKLLF